MSYLPTFGPLLKIDFVTHSTWQKKSQLVLEKGFCEQDKTMPIFSQENKKGICI